MGEVTPAKWLQLDLKVSKAQNSQRIKEAGSFFVVSAWSFALFAAIVVWVVVSKLLINFIF